MAVEHHERRRDSDTMSTTMKQSAILILLLIVCGGCSMLGSDMSSYEKPKYSVVTSKKNIEIRKYDSMIIAEVEVEGQRRESIGKGFRVLANYIFGDNSPNSTMSLDNQANKKQKDKIAMTAPVQQQSSKNMWKISFIMPGQYTLETLPKPNDNQIRIKTVPQKEYVVIRFTGMSNDSNIRKHEEQLLAYIADNDLQTSGAAIYAFYDPPFTPPFLRRNEVMFEIQKNV